VREYRTTSTRRLPRKKKEAREENDGPIMAEVQEAFMRLI